MKTTSYKKSQVAMLVAGLLGTSLATPIYAEQLAQNENAEKGVEVIEVKGIRGSLIRAMDLKREAFGVMDAISAEEMGKFPDTNLAESLQRITGVSVSRSNGEGSEITVRGFGPSFNLVTLNGRQMPGTGNSRSYKLENLAAEGVSTLEVYKTARAEKPTGGLGATVNIVTAKPLQKPGQRFSLMAKGIHDTSVEEGDEVTPEIAKAILGRSVPDSWDPMVQKIFNWGQKVFSSFSQMEKGSDKMGYRNILQRISHCNVNRIYTFRNRV